MAEYAVYTATGKIAVVVSVDGGHTFGDFTNIDSLEKAGRIARALNKFEAEIEAEIEAARLKEASGDPS